MASSFALGASALLLALTTVVVCIDFKYIAGATGRPYSESLTARALLLSSITLPALSLLGGGLGLAGWLNGQREKLAWLSVVGNSAVFLFVCTLLALSYLLEGYGSTP